MAGGNQVVAVNGYDSVNARTNRLVVTDDGREELATVEDGLSWCNRRRPGEQGMARPKADCGGRELSHSVTVNCADSDRPATRAAQRSRPNA